MNVGVGARMEQASAAAVTATPTSRNHLSQQQRQHHSPSPSSSTCFLFHQSTKSTSRQDVSHLDDVDQDVDDDEQSCFPVHHSDHHFGHLDLDGDSNNSSTSFHSSSAAANNLVDHSSILVDDQNNNHPDEINHNNQDDLKRETAGKQSDTDNELKHQQNSSNCNNSSNINNTSTNLTAEGEPEQELEQEVEQQHQEQEEEEGMHNMLSGSSASSSSPGSLLVEVSNEHALHQPHHHHLNSPQHHLNHHHHHHLSHHHLNHHPHLNHHHLNHDEHSFSRISLEEYSPSPLVEEEDDALAGSISPSTSPLTNCHHFKSSLQNLVKLDEECGLVGEDVDENSSSALHHHHLSHHHLHHVVDVDDDARSLSPTLLHHHSSSHHHHQQQLWSTSSTAITPQSTSLLNSTHSSSFFLANQHQHHHHQQLSSLIQQLEPQSLDEPPAPLIGGGVGMGAGTNATNTNSNSNTSTTNNNNNNSANHSLFNSSGTGLTESAFSHFQLHQQQALTLHRPSSEPPPNCSLHLGSLNGGVNDASESLIEEGLSADAESSKSINSSKCFARNSTIGCGKQTLSNSSSSSTRRKTSITTSTHTTSGGGSSRRRRNRSNTKHSIVESLKSNEHNNKRQVNLDPYQQQEQKVSSKVHLQLNHHKKLQELQQRLFGASITTTTTSSPSSINIDNKLPSTHENSNSNPTSSINNLFAPAEVSLSTLLQSSQTCQIKQEPDSVSSGTNQTSHNNSSSLSSSKKSDLDKNEVRAVATRQTTSGIRSSLCVTRTRSSRRSRTSGSNKSNNSSSSSTSSTNNTGTNNSNNNHPSSSSQTRKNQQSGDCAITTQKLVTAVESVEPDTTTKSSDCIKLADLLSSGCQLELTTTNNKSTTTNCHLTAGNIGFITNGFASKLIDLNTASSSMNNLMRIGAETGDSTQSNNNNNNNLEKHVQQIQLQVSPAVTLLANGNLVQHHSSNAGGTSMLSTANLNHSATTPGQQQFQLCTNQRQQRNSKQESSPSSSNETTASQQMIKSEPNNSGGGALIAADWSLQGVTPQNPNQALQQTATIGAHQIAIQVICQDGTSLVLPVSSAAGLNAAVSLTTQHQQLQAVLAQANAAAAVAAAAANQQQQQQQQQSLPLMSVSNIVAQQQLKTNGSNQLQDANVVLINNNSQPMNNPHQQQAPTSALAASSPTLAALLDAGSTTRLSSSSSSSSSSNPLISGGLSFVGNDQQLCSNNQANFVSGNLLRKLVSGGAMEQGSSTTTLNNKTLASLNLGLSQNGSLITLSPHQTIGAGRVNSTTTTTTATTTGVSCESAVEQKNINDNLSGSLEKRIKLERVELQHQPAVALANNQQSTTFTLLESQGIIVANGNQKPVGNLTTTTTNAQLNSGTNLSITQTATLQQQHQQQQLNTPKPTNNSDQNIKQHNKMSSSTGNRQVDPTQPFRCEHCNSTFTRLGNFTRHKKIHTIPTKDGQRFKCDVCSKSFLQRCDLARHLHIHRGTEPHRCNICGKGYIRHSDLVTHQRFHNKEKPFGCPHCSKGFCQRGDLNRHLRSIHLQMKPILCPCCNRKFAKQETLLRHLNTAHRSKPGQMGSLVSTNINTTTLTAGALNDSSLKMTNNEQCSNLIIPAQTNTTQEGDDKQQHTTTNSLVVNDSTLTLSTNTPTSLTTDLTKQATNVALTPHLQTSTRPKDSHCSTTRNDNLKNAPANPSHAIQANLCKVSQSVDPTTASETLQLIDANASSLISNNTQQSVAVNTSVSSFKHQVSRFTTSVKSEVKE